MNQLCEYISLLIIISIVCIHKDILGEFTLTNSENAEIFVPTKTILRTSTETSIVQH